MSRAHVACLVLFSFAPAVSLAALPKDRLGWTPIVAGDRHAFALHAPNQFVGWGYDADNRLGTGLPNTTQRDIPTAITSIPSIKAIATGYGHTLVLTWQGHVYAFGNNAHGQLGDGTTQSSATPKQITTLANISAIAVGPNTSFAITSGKKVIAWGLNTDAQMGLGHFNPVLTPTLVPGLTNIVGVSGGAYHTVALDTAGAVWTWGYDAFGQLGDGGTATRKTPIKVTALTSPIAQVSAGRLHTLARGTDGRVWSFGADDLGQLGNNATLAGSGLPVQVSGITNAKLIAAGYNFGMAVLANGALYAWGANSEGQLGDGSRTNRPTPVRNLDFENVVSIAAGQESAFAVDVNGQLHAWGYNGDGRLGTGTHGANVLIPKKAMFAYVYRVLVIPTARAHHGLSELDPFVTAIEDTIERESYGKVAMSIDYMPLVITTPAAIGCTGNMALDAGIVDNFSLSKAIAKGHDLSTYGHVIVATNDDLRPACNLGGVSGGIYGGALGQGEGTGIVSMSSWGNYGIKLPPHEFTHGYGRGCDHLELLYCPGSVVYTPTELDPRQNPACVVSDSPGSMDPMAAGGAPDSPDQNASAPMKVAFGWIPEGYVSTFNAGTAANQLVLMQASDTATQPLDAFSAIRIKLSDNESIFLEYRVKAHTGAAPGYAIKPGIYATLARGSVPFTYLLKSEENTSGYNGLGPLKANTAIRLTPKVTVTVTTVTSSTASVRVVVTP